MKLINLKCLSCCTSAGLPIFISFVGFCCRISSRNFSFSVFSSAMFVSADAELLQGSNLIPIYKFSKKQSVDAKFETITFL